MIFARSVLFVEGEGDRLFFEVLRQRIAARDDSGVMDDLGIVWTGSKSSFAPWLKLVESYGSDGIRPIEWLAVADGADAATDLAAAFSASGIRLPLQVRREIQVLNDANASGDQTAAVRATRNINREARGAGVRFHLVPVDLEWCALQSASSTVVKKIAVAMNSGHRSRDPLLAQLGSKYGGGPVGVPAKAPWIRGLIARELPWKQVSTDAVEILRRWIQGATADPKRTREILRAAAQAHSRD